MLEAGSSGGHQMYSQDRAPFRVHYGFGRLMHIFPKQPTGRDAEYIDPEPNLRNASYKPQIVDILVLQRERMKRTRANMNIQEQLARYGESW